MKRYLFLAVIGSLVVGCDGRSEQEKVQGKWVLREMYGWFTFGLPPYGKDDKDVLIFDGDRFDFINNERSDKRVSGTFFCDPTKSPKEITFSYGDRNIVAIYSLSGSDLRICVGSNDGIPPKTFDGGPRERPALISFRRPDPK